MHCKYQPKQLKISCRCHETSPKLVLFSLQKDIFNTWFLPEKRGNADAEHDGNEEEEEDVKSGGTHGL